DTGPSARGPQGYVDAGIRLGGRATGCMAVPRRRTAGMDPAVRGSDRGRGRKPAVLDSVARAGTSRAACGIRAARRSPVAPGSSGLDEEGRTSVPVPVRTAVAPCPWTGLPALRGAAGRGEGRGGREVRTMRLTWKDGLATVLTAGIVALYVAFVAGADLPLLSSARGIAVAALVLGIGGCAAG